MRNSFIKKCLIVIFLLTTVITATSCSSSDLNSNANIYIKVKEKETGSPLEDAAINVKDVGSKKTDAQGIAKFKGLKQKQYQFIISKTGYETKSDQVTATKKEEFLTYKLEQQRDSEVTVVDINEYIDLTDTEVKFLFKTEIGAEIDFYLGTSKDNLEKRKVKTNFNNEGVTIDNLTPEQTYYYKIKVINGEEKTVSRIKSFTKLGNTNNWERPDWAKTAVFYEVFVRSFYDGNGDGIGDFKGLQEKIPYFEELGVDALWLMPVNKSPSYHGYDVVDYYETDPDYGTVEEFREFLKAAHNAGLKVIMDLVVNHSSANHPWFEESQEGRGNKYSDYYVWNDPFDNTEEEGPWDQYPIWHEVSSRDTNSSNYYDHYYAIFWDQMPDLNYRNPEVRKKMKEVAKFWLDPNGDGNFNDGVDGFRLDAALHIDDKKPAVTHNWWQEFNTAVKSVNPDAFLVGENWTDTQTMAEFFKDLDASFNFPVADKILNMADGYNNDIVAEINDIHQVYSSYSDEYIDTTFLRNHDQIRVASKLHGNENKMKLAASLLFTLPGTPFIYYGEEIGQRGTKPPDEHVREPFDWYEDAQGPGMTTMSKGGFSHDMKYTNANDGISLEEQQGVEGSLFEYYKKLIDIRKKNPILFTGEYSTSEVNTPAEIYGYKVSGSAADNLFVVHNLEGASCKIGVSTEVKDLITDTTYSTSDDIQLRAYGTAIFKTTADTLTIDLKSMEDIDKYSVTFTVNAPESTPEDANLYCASELNGWNPAASDYKLTKLSSGTYQITLEADKGSSIQFKFTRGKWDKCEFISEDKVLEPGFTRDGSGSINRVYEFTADNQSKTLTISEWEDKK